MKLPQTAVYLVQFDFDKQTAVVLGMTKTTIQRRDDVHDGFYGYPSPHLHSSPPTPMLTDPGWDVTGRANWLQQFTSRRKMRALYHVFRQIVGECK